MSHHPIDPVHRRDEKGLPRQLKLTWLEKSLVSPSVPVFYERSDGEKMASQYLIQEKAKSEQWSRAISKTLFALKLAAFLIPLSFLAGVAVSMFLMHS
jgi:hypothetical protein